MVRNVAVPASNSVVKVVFLSLILNRLPTLLLATHALRRVITVSRAFDGGGGAVPDSISIVPFPFFFF